MRKRKVRGEFKTTCSKCGKELEPNRVGKYRYCNVCHAEHMRNTRPKHSDLSDEARKKANCRSYTKELIKRGKVLLMPCWICGEGAEAHHEDYGNPRDIIWLCRTHHLEYHKEHDCSKQ